jgi:hypothetical protein
MRVALVSTGLGRILHCTAGDRLGLRPFMDTAATMLICLQVHCIKIHLPSALTNPAFS